MRHGSGGTVFDPVEPERRDREVTIGPFLLTLIGGVLFALCGLCFVLGYSVGRRNADSTSTISVPPAATSGISPQGMAPSKPSAGQGGAPVSGVPADMSEPVEGDSSGGSIPTESGAGSAAAAGPGAASAEPAVHAVVASQTSTQASSVGTVQPAIAQQGAIMVQIAAVTHSEDADVLVGALRKRGYAVNARRDPADGLLHVQVGPFANRSDAYAMRQKLLNDGYNAIVQP